MKRYSLEDLIRIAEEHNLAEIEVSRPLGGRIRIRRSEPASTTPATPPPRTQTPTQAPVAPVPRIVPIISPMVGTFYRAPSPDAPPYVEAGDEVKPGQVVCVVEAMKLMNEIESEVSGRIVEILAKNEEPVEFGQELFRIELS